MKRRMCSLALSTLLGLGVAIAAPLAQDQPAQGSQNAGRHPMDPNRQLSRLTKKLNLSADQQNQILPILSARQQEMQSIWSDNSLSAQDRHAKMRAVREDSDSKIRALLNDTQKQTYDQMQQQARERAKEHREQRQGTGTGSGNLN